ncbi:retrovirus-related pol polyprotein from transposon TNT 1-94 [Tanacetum coccineum]
MIPMTLRLVFPPWRAVTLINPNLKIPSKKTVLVAHGSLRSNACREYEWEEVHNNGGLLFREAVATTCYTQNRSLICSLHNKTPYDLLHDRKPDLKYFHVFGALCYPTNDSENLGKLKPKAHIGIFIVYSPTKKAYQIYNKRTRLIMETIHVEFDELAAMASEQFRSGPELQLMTPGSISSRLVQNPSSSTPYVPPTKKDWDILFPNRCLMNTFKPSLSCCSSL